MQDLKYSIYAHTNDMKEFEELLVSKVGLDIMQARVFLYVTIYGKSTAVNIAAKLGIAKNDIMPIVESLVTLGAFIDMPDEIFEAMHPRFTVVNMYKRRCEHMGVEFGRNKIVDSIGAALERPYEHARAK
ncbi:MAG: hypothetical protein K8823_1145 [Cenarchaeum symbiont of Oopsacas minuta]|nr:hypothetical protein [Cenarchaeum symbiont of Oopsacas minuta]